MGYCTNEFDGGQDKEVVCCSKDDCCESNNYPKDDKDDYKTCSDVPLTSPYSYEINLADSMSNIAFNQYLTLSQHYMDIYEKIGPSETKLRNEILAKSLMCAEQCEDVLCLYHP